MRHRSPGLTAIYNEVKSPTKHRVLDLGPLVAANLNFFSGLKCQIYFENLDGFIDEHKILSSDNLIFQLEKFLTEHDSSQKFDIILIWDLLNYLPLQVVTSLFNLLGSYCKPNTLLHSIKYTTGKIPANPAKFKITDQFDIDIDASRWDERRIEPHKTAALLQQIPHYYLHNNLMNETGMVAGVTELIMRYEPEKSASIQYVPTGGIPVKQSISAAPGNIPARPYTPAQGEQLFESPAIQSLLSSAQEKRTILDLGMKSNHNLGFWRSHIPQVFCEDLSSSLCLRNRLTKKAGASPATSSGHAETGKPAESIAGSINREPRSGSTVSLSLGNNAVIHNDIETAMLSDEALRFDSGLSFDVIMLWDILNYCSNEQIAAIGEKLKPHCDNNTTILTFLYSGTTIPSEPQQYHLADKGYYCINDVKKDPRQYIPLTTTSIIKLIPGWINTKTHFYAKNMRPGLVELEFKYPQAAWR